MRGRFAASLWLALAVVAPVPQAGQQPPQGAGGEVEPGQFFESIEVNVVNVDVYVTDKKGNRVHGLTQGDFEIFEDDRPVAITNFYAVENGGPVVEAPAAPAAAAAPSPSAAPERRPLPSAPADIPEDQRLHLVVYVDNWNIQPFDRNRTFTGLREFLRTKLTRADRVMLMTYDREPHVRRPFTSDPATIAAALFEVEKLSAQGAAQERDRREALRDIQDLEDAAAAASRARRYAEEVYNDLGFSINSIKEITSSLAGLPGRKAILYVSGGLPLIAGEDIFHAVHEKYPTQTSSLLEAQNFNLTRRFEELVATANANRITFYTIDAGGLRVSSSISAEERTASASGFVDAVHWSNIQGSLRMMAEDTGGLAILNSNDPTMALARVGDDLGNYYSLGYSPAHSGDGRYHEIEVRVKGRKDLVVRNREGYRDKTSEARMSDGVMSALFFDVESNPLGIVIDRQRESRRDDGNYLVPIEVRIPIGKLVLVPQGELQIARVRVFVAAMDRDGGISEVQQAGVPIEIPAAEVAQATGKVWVYTVPLLMRPGPQKLAVGVRDDVAQTGSFTVRTMTIGS